MVYLLDDHLSSTTERYYRKQVDTSWNQRPTLDYVMCQLFATFKTTTEASQVMKLFMPKNDSKRTWVERFLYTVAVSDVGGARTRLFRTSSSTTLHLS